MALPICVTCAKIRILCAACEKKLSSGKINEFDIEVSRVLYELFGEDADFTHAVDTENYIIIIVKGEDIGKVIGKGGENLRLISQRLGRQVRVVGKDSFNDMVSAFVAPAKVNSINTVLKPGGLRAIRVRINRKDSTRLRMKLHDLQKLVSAITDQEVELIFD